MNKSSLKSKTMTAFIVSVVLGGFNGIGVHYTVLELPPFWGAVLRFIPAAVIMLLLVFFLKLPFPRGKALWGAVLFGLLNFAGSFALIYNGLRFVQPGMASVLLTLVPLFTMFFAIAHRQERFHWRSVLGALIAVGGIALVFQEQLQTNVPISSLLSIVLGTVFLAEAGVVVKSFPKNHPVTTNAIAMTVGAIILFIMSLLWHEPQTLPIKSTTWIALIYLILLGTCVVFMLALYILKNWPASTTSYQFVLFPLVTLTASAWLAHEALSPILLIGAVLVLSGVIIGLLSTSKKSMEKKPLVNEVQTVLTENCE